MTEITNPLWLPWLWGQWAWMCGRYGRRRANRMMSDIALAERLKDKHGEIRRRTIQFDVEFEYDRKGNRKLTQSSKKQIAQVLNDYWDEQEKKDN